MAIENATGAEVEAFEPKMGATLNGRYELEARIGVGGMGEVWRARDLSLRRQVAVKFLSGALADREETRNRFLVEAQVTAQLNSRHAVLVYDFGVTGGGHPYFVLELLHGETLAHRLERVGKLDPEATIAILRKAARALSRAHALRIVHRDFKPDNVFLTVSADEGEEQGEDVKVVDFGIAKMIGNLEEARASVEVQGAAIAPSAQSVQGAHGAQEAHGAQGAPAAQSVQNARNVQSLDTLSPEAMRSLTRTNSFIGTPQYMPPEQINQSEVGPPVDIWALGVVAFECLTGTSPFAGRSVLELFASIQLGRAHSAHALDPTIPPAFDAWFARATAQAPEERFTDANQAVAELAAAILPGRAAMPSAVEAPRVRSNEGIAFGDRTSTGAGVEHLPQAAGLPRKRSPAWVATVAIVVLALAGAGVVRLRGKGAAETGAAAVGPAPVASVSSVSEVPVGGSSAVSVAGASSAVSASAVSASAAVGATPGDAPAAIPSAGARSPSAPPKNLPAGKGRGGRAAKEAASAAPVPTPAASTAAPKPSEPAAAKRPAASPSSPFTLPPLGL
ncbi:protein kinase domain-containing protein [Pendulispora albinea]|uniref:serine/threonine-protein kinase n=1 Tax=Pendulispora albinea TaxID=2741071 RepID=UPI00374E1436